ncbi:Hypothetical protein Tpal_745 [Trichococcus palustris]|uniref:DUF1002 domain-containing protein n=1 Tax=Trichococcus palustris TaxID=140314 RepID=A0A143YCW9_9LACT|nr:DUF1002 domain-containing protein [Trichococcus palustris]CZQ86229.1 Hypothetical protein Tpal_745 [Trichococcus palustris]SFK58160.1 Uncharacterized protein YpuA, DUF1002 family [Trichococcus palustris]
MKLKKMVTVGLASMTLLGVTAPMAFADKVAIEPVFTYGESLNASQLEKTKTTLGVAYGTKKLVVQVNELNDLLHDDYPYNQVYSSTYITPADSNGDVKVEILTPETITAITETQYENAAITAGAVDVNIKVASAVTVDGSGALAGVYKAFAASGKALDDKAVEVAQEELAVTSTVTQENSGNSGYSDELMNAAVAEMKQNIQETKDANGGAITSDAIRQIVEDVLKNYNLDSILSANNITNIQNLMVNFGDINLTVQQKEQLSALGSELQAKGGELFDQAKTTWNNVDKTQLKKDGLSIWESIVRFFTNLFGGNDSATSN